MKQPFWKSSRRRAVALPRWMMLLGVPLAMGCTGLLGLFAPPVAGYKIQTIAGGGTAYASDKEVDALAMKFDSPMAVTEGRDGSLLVADDGGIYTISVNGVVTNLLKRRGRGDRVGSLKTFLGLVSVNGLTLDSSGKLLVSDWSNQRIFRIDALTGSEELVAGSDSLSLASTPGRFSGDGGAATGAELHSPAGLAVDVDGNIFFADSGNNRIRKIARDGIITTVAGSGERDSGGSNGDNGPATSAALSGPKDICFDAEGSLLIADTGHHQVRKVGKDGRISTIAGASIPPPLRQLGFTNYGGDGGLAIQAVFKGPRSIAVDHTGNVLVADTGNNRVRIIGPNGVITTLVGTGWCGYSGDGGEASATQICGPLDLSFTKSGHLLIADGGTNRIRKVSPPHRGQ